MRTSRWIVAMGLFGTLSLGCGDDDDTGAEKICKEQCKRGKACGHFDDSNFPQPKCISSCVDAAESEMSSSDCTFTNAQINDCVSAISTESCDVLKDTLPEKCSITCEIADK